VEWKTLRVLWIAAALALSSCVSSSDTAGGWTCQYCKNVTTFSGSTLSFTFPKTDGVHYVTKPFSPTAPKTIAATFTITAGKFVAAGSGTPKLYLYFQRAGDDMQALKGTTEYYRWWSNPQSVVLAGGTYTLSVALQPKDWTSVWGARGTENVKMFNEAVSNMRMAGMTFGSDSGGFGHGAWDLLGRAVFTLKSFEVR
jgi:hypothetical protein